MSKAKLSIRLDLDGDLLKMFDTIKREWMIENATDVIRHLIAEEFKRIKSK